MDFKTNFVDGMDTPKKNNATYEVNFCNSYFTIIFEEQIDKKK